MVVQVWRQDGRLDVGGTDKFNARRCWRLCPRRPTVLCRWLRRTAVPQRCRVVRRSEQRMDQGKAFVSILTSSDISVVQKSSRFFTASILRFVFPRWRHCVLGELGRASSIFLVDSRRGWPSDDALGKLSADVGSSHNWFQICRHVFKQFIDWNQRSISLGDLSGIYLAR